MAIRRKHSEKLHGLVQYLCITDIVTYRLNWSRGRFSKNVKFLHFKEYGGGVVFCY